MTKNIKKKTTQSQRKDTIFKNTLSVANFVPRKIKKERLGDFYVPDKILENEDTVIFFESSSTGERKTHIGELIQFLTYVNSKKEEKDNIYFVLFLCGKSKTSPTVEIEHKRLQYYYQSYFIEESKKEHIKGIYIANQNTIDIKNLTLEKIQEFMRIDKTTEEN